MTLNLIHSQGLDVKEKCLLLDLLLLVLLWNLLALPLSVDPFVSNNLARIVSGIIPPEMFTSYQELFSPFILGWDFLCFTHFIFFGRVYVVSCTEVGM